MKKSFILLALVLFFLSAKSQNCDDLIRYVKSESYGTVFSSPLSDAISKVTFYQISIDYKIYYFAIVCFKNKNSYGCTEYIYQVAHNTRLLYSMEYLDSAGSAFWKFIQPYHVNLDCSPSLK
jgi:hypothetical protein